MIKNRLLALLFFLLGGITLYDSISNILDYLHGIEISFSSRGNYVKNEKAFFQYIVLTIFGLFMILVGYTFIRKKDNKTLDDK